MNNIIYQVAATAVKCFSYTSLNKCKAGAVRRSPFVLAIHAHEKNATTSGAIALIKSFTGSPVII